MATEYPATLTRSVPVSCSKCGAKSLTSEVVYSDADHRRMALRCEKCGEVWSEEEETREEVRGYLCGPGAGGSTLLGKVWGPAPRRAGVGASRARSDSPPSGLGSLDDLTRDGPDS